MAANQATEQILDLRYTLRMMGIPIDGKSWLFGRNQSVITSYVRNDSQIYLNQTSQCPLIPPRL